ncbi:rhomboid family intramembrane serine protease [Hirschia baltica]|uniref:Rhomboid family protein n=1 Tax=Hirschia baltica (strain ATCC 49814 / DSM 5838 / IFAM 1418) TaxID=582402 RepID=C6XRQ3_HIRBI|nr:rhomboid family intramembrane serine protease [Hirschia baltica]ACT60663.1 Rhomboid family protein [Hirschia baltica ATCC 49814]
MFEVLLGAPITLALIAANVAFSLIGFSNEKFFRANYLLVGDIVQKHQWYRVLTSGFLHVSPGHLLLNMLTLFFFGPYLEIKLLGPTGYLLVYFVSLIAGGAWAVLENYRRLDYSAVGASGAVSGALISFCMFEPFSLIYLFMIIPIPAIVFGVAFISYSAFASGNEDSKIGHEAHLGGAIAGLLVTVCLHPGILNSLISQVLSLVSSV